MAKRLVSSSTRPNWACTFSLTSSFFLSISSSLALKVESADLDISSSSLDIWLLKLRLPEFCTINWFCCCGCSIVCISPRGSSFTETLLLPWIPLFISFVSLFSLSLCAFVWWVWWIFASFSFYLFLWLVLINKAGWLYKSLQKCQASFALSFSLYSPKTLIINSRPVILTSGQIFFSN